MAMKMKTPRSFRELCLQIADSSIGMVEEFCHFCRFGGELGRAALQAAAHPRRIKWKSVAYYMDSCGSDAMPIIALLAFQAIVQLGRFGVENYVVNLVGTVIVTELAPLVTAVVLAGRTGSSFAAELSSMKADEEIDAMVTLGFDTGRFLLLPKLLAMILIMPGLTIISDVCGIVGGMAIVCSMLHVSVAEYFARTFEIIQPIDLMQGLTKSVVFGVIVAAVGCMKGLYAERDAQGIGRAATSAVVTAIFLIVVVDALLTSLFGIAS